MESSTHTHRALTAGLSIGAGIAVSAAAFAATIPFDDIHATVTTALVPFAVGSLAGVGIHAIATAIDDHVAASDRRGARQARAEKRRMSENRVADGLFSTARQATPKGVPVIARAQDALSEAEAWAEIDSLLSSDSPVSCDPLKSKDIYEIALEEMARGTAQTAQAQATPSADQTAQTQAVQSEPAARTAQVAQAAPAWGGVTVGPEETATYMRIQAVARAQAQAQSAAAPGVPAASAVPVVPVVPVTPAAQVATAAPAATPQPASAVPASQVPAITVDTQQPAPASPAFRMAGIDDTNVLVALAAASAAARAATDTLMSAQAAEAKVASAPATDSAAESKPEVEVPMVDYSGHEDMWAKALAILAEEDSAHEAASPVQPVAASQESQLLDEDDGPIAKIFDGLDKIPWSDDYDTVLEDTDAVGRARMSAIAEGARDTGVHTRVNEIIDEEFNRVPSQSVRTTSREYLRVIQGGTVAMPRYTAEA